MTAPDIAGLVVLAVLALVTVGNIVMLVVARKDWQRAERTRHLVRERAADMRDFNVEAVEALRTVVPLFEDMISRDPVIAEPLEVNRLVLLDAIRKMTARAAVFDAIHRGDSPAMRDMLSRDDDGGAQ